MGKYCTHCGSALKPDLKFCTSCGAATGNMGRRPVAGSSNAVGSVQLQPTPAQPPTPQYGQQHVSADAPQLRIQEQQPKKRKAKEIWLAVTACFLCLCIISSVCSGAVLLRDRTPGETARTRSEKAVPVSGTKAFKTSPTEGITILGEENSLDKERTFTAHRLTGDAIEQLVDTLASKEYLLLDGFEIDAGLPDSEQFPGLIDVDIDLNVLEIPNALREFLGAVRIGDDGSIKLLHTVIDGSTLRCNTDQNSMIVVVVVASTLGGLVFTGLDRMEMYAGGITGFYNTTPIPHYSIYWPNTMPFGNPEAVKKQAGKLTAALKKHGLDPKDNFALSVIRKIRDEKSSDFRDALKTTLGKYYSDQDFQAALREAGNLKWQQQNVWPIPVQQAIKALQTADEYIFTIRGFRRPGHVVEVTLLDKWPHEGDRANPVFGISGNPYTASPFIHINLEHPEIPKTAAEIPAKKAGIDNLLLTTTHELFHVVQAGYVRYDRESDFWFWEATAVLLESEAASYYLDKQLIASYTPKAPNYATFIHTLGGPATRSSEYIMRN